jgi:alkanesulfonate monooxygenase SsuD/methylene tetrahydromethanopterin reductase-like flavin-dependent oxidoreductase (luciferase family)
MDVGIGLPNSLIGVRGPDLVDWAQRAERDGFSVLGTIGRIVYDTYEELVSLAAAAGATERIELMTTVLVAPPRQPVLLAKQAATLSRVSGGRFRLGLGLGPREDDWLALGVEPTDRGRRLDEVIDTCRAVWAGEPPLGVEGRVGPLPEHLPLVLSGSSESAYRRAGQKADAFLAGPMPPESVGQAFQAVTNAAEEADRPTPKLYAARYAALGDDASDEADRNVASYYGSAGAEFVSVMSQNVLRTPMQVRETLTALEQQGCQELCLWPLATGAAQVDRLAEAALS